MATITNQAALTYRGLTRLSNITTGRVDSGLTAEQQQALERTRLLRPELLNKEF